MLSLQIITSVSFYSGTEFLWSQWLIWKKIKLMGLLACVKAILIWRREIQLCMQKRNILLPRTITPDSFEIRLHILLCLFVTFISSLILNFPQLLFFLCLLICLRHSLQLSPLFKISCISLSSHLDCCSSFLYSIPKLQYMAFVK